jgi:hypothetical protein
MVSLHIDGGASERARRRHGLAVVEAFRAREASEQPKRDELRRLVSSGLVPMRDARTGTQCLVAAADVAARAARGWVRLQAITRNDDRKLIVASELAAHKADCWTPTALLAGEV